MEKMTEPRFFLGCACCDEAELEMAEGVMDSVDDCLDWKSDSGRSTKSRDFSTGDVICERAGGTLLVVEPSVEKMRSLEVREGADVKLVDCVS